jgi:hypothetical protein
MARGRIKKRRIGTEVSTLSLCAATCAWIRVSLSTAVSALNCKSLACGRSDEIGSDETVMLSIPNI